MPAQYANMSDNWNPAQYEKFKAQRAKPFFDLLSLIHAASFGTAVDLGCGTGELTRVLFDTLRPDHLLGVDTSPEMLAKSDAFRTGGLAFSQQDIASYQAEAPLDLLFSNAALHWLPDHASLFPRLMSYVAGGGQLAIQMPYNFDHPSHVVAQRTALDLFPHAFNADHPLSGTLKLETYAEMLFKHGFAEQVCRVEVYAHPMRSGEDVVEWTKGSLLTAYQQRLSADEFRIFLAEYRRALLAEIGTGPYFYAFKRILLWGRKS